MAAFYPLVVEEVRQETDDCVSVSFRLPAELREVFRFQPGQHLGIRKTIGGEELRRTYSLCTDPVSGVLRVAIKKVPGGRFSTFANEDLQAGDTLEVMAPAGRFGINIDPGRRRHLVAFAAGSGITPIMSIMRSVLAHEPGSHFTLFYGNSRLDSIIFREALESLKNQYLDRLSIYHLLSRQEQDIPLFNGRINKEKADRLIDGLLDLEAVDEVFLCGPFGMVEAVRDSLLERGMPEARIHLELFAPAGEQAARPRARPAQSFEGGTIRIILDGQQFSVPITDRDATILDLAHRAGIDLPYACKGGVCSTCRAHLEKGAVDMPVNYALENDELAADYILTCQSYPLTENLRVNFDA